MWAPDIQYVNGRYIVYYSALENGSNRYCIGAAVSTTDSALGPYKDLEEPLVRSHAFLGDTIDVHHFTDVDGTTYLLWKTNGDPFWLTSHIIIRKINPDGISFDENEPETLILKNDQLWELVTVEGPWLVHRNGFYYLFYSGDGYLSNGYSVGVARSQNILGPYQKGGRILHTNFEAFDKGENTSFVAPGHCSVVEVSQNTFKVSLKKVRIASLNLYNNNANVCVCVCLKHFVG